jgi:SAM-dependent methyltransferase
MPAKTYYFLTTTAVTPNWFGSLQDGGTAPTAASTAFGWAPSKTAISTPYYKAFIGATGTSSAASASNYLTASPGNTGPQKGTGSGATTAGDSFVTPAALTGSFALDRNSLVLDYGCGIGRIAKELIKQTGCHVIGVDISPSMLGLAYPYVHSDNLVLFLKQRSED